MSENLHFKTSLIYGPSGAGKTAFCASYPRVAMLSSRREGGLETVEYMDPSMWYDPRVKPLKFEVEDIGDMMRTLHQRVLPLVDKGVVRSICIELTFHADDAMRKMPVDDRNGWAKYANLEQHIINLDELIKLKRGARLVYNTLNAPEDKAKETSGVLIPGRALARKIPAMVNPTGFLRPEEGADVTERILHLTAYGNYSPRHRYGNRLPRFVRWRAPSCCFRDLEDLLFGRARTNEEGLVERVEPAVVMSLPSLPPLKK